MNSFPAGAVPTGFTSNATVEVFDSNDVSIANATVTMNGVTLAYNAANEDYEGNVIVLPGGTVTVSVTAQGATYTASATQFTSYPTISAPVSGATWDSAATNAVTWSGGAPTANAGYAIGFLDVAAPNGLLVWPEDHFLQEIPIASNSFSIPANRITGGDRFLLVGITSQAVPIPNTAPGSGLVVGGFNYAPITVTGLPVTFRDSGTASSLSGITWSGSQFVAVGGDIDAGGTILTSPDGITWTSRSSGTSHFLTGVAWSGAQFVALGRTSGGGPGGPPLSPPVILTSPDGISWTSRSPGVSSDLLAAASSPTLTVVVGESGTIVTSADGITWTGRTSGTFASLRGVAWSGAKFVAVGNSGVILISPDGITWTTQTSVSGDVTGVVWSGSQFVAVGGPDAMFTSPDGVTWTAHSSGSASNPAAVAFSGTGFMAVGSTRVSPDLLGTIVTSPDGVTWTPRASGVTGFLNGVASSGTGFVAVGEEGTILTSP